MVSENDWNELKSILLEIRENVSKLADEAGKEQLTPNEICKMLKINRNTFQNHLNKKVIRYTKIKGKIYVQRSEIQRLIDQGKL